MKCVSSCSKMFNLFQIVVSVFHSHIVKSYCFLTKISTLFTVGGRLAKEIEYTEKMLGKEFGITQEVIIQTPNYKGTNLLTVDAMLMHMKALKKVATIKVKVEDR